MEFIKKAIRIGNSAGVLLPKKLLGAEVKIIVLKKPTNIKKELFKILSNFLDDIIAACSLENDPLEILVVSGKTKKIIKQNNIKISIIPLDIIKKDLEKSAVLKAKIKKSKPILNGYFFENLLSNLKR